jgi:uncharacterized membrane protein
MENKSVGELVIGMAIVMAIIVWMFNTLIKKNLDLTCSHGPTCEMYSGLNIQTWVSVILIGIILIIGIIIMFSKPKEKIIETVKYKTKTVTEKKKSLDLSGLNAKEKQAVQMLQKEGGMFQKTLMESLEIGKVGMTRMLDKLEAKQIIERKRRGMNNFVVLKGL